MVSPSVTVLLHVCLEPLQVYKDRKVVEQLVRRAERAGFKAIALTVDTPRLGRREADIKNRSVLLGPCLVRCSDRSQNELQHHAS